VVRVRGQFTSRDWSQDSQSEDFWALSSHHMRSRFGVIRRYRLSDKNQTPTQQPSENLAEMSFNFGTWITSPEQRLTCARACARPHPPSPHRTLSDAYPTRYQRVDFLKRDPTENIQENILSGLDHDVSSAGIERRLAVELARHTACSSSRPTFQALSANVDGPSAVNAWR